ncbi:hypothetical protein ACFORJ_01800 [Corynebacterium hansenii]|uniref:Uncharacterized protein n=1 Tax=Corynebacterium hansenii TaxID=394964 RepID=A0ABV7ZK39_9CORY|nr:hypothetical protein [Corynebacterium hansenii]WJY99267.1 hypothetical protein CHAN_03195 [Corynebacterium hansenii]
MSSRREKLHRTAMMAVIGGFAITTGSAYLVPSTPASLAQLEAISWIPMPALGVLWIVSGLLAVLAIPVRRIQPVAIGLVGSLTVAWAASFATSVLLTDITRAWVSAKNYAAIAALIALHASAPVRAGTIKEVIVYDVGHDDPDHRGD